MDELLFSLALDKAQLISELQRIRVTARARGEHYSSGQLDLLLTTLARDVRDIADECIAEANGAQC